MSREEIIKIIKEIEKETEGYAPYPLKYFLKDDGYRISVSASFFDGVYEALEYYGQKNKKMENIEKFLGKAFYDYDSRGFYYWIPYSDPPRGFTTPAWRMANL